MNYDEDNGWHKWNMDAKRRILMDATTAPVMTPYFTDRDSMGSDAATRVSSLTSKTTTSYPSSAKGKAASKRSLSAKKMESNEEVEKEFNFESDSLEGRNDYKDFSLDDFNWSHDEQKGNMEENEASIGQRGVSLEESINGKRLGEEDQEQVDQETTSIEGVVAYLISGQAEEKKKKKKKV